MNLDLDALKPKIQAYAAKHPWQAIGIAFAAGAVMGLVSRERPGEPGAGVHRRGIGGALAGALGALATRLIKDATLAQVAGYATDWLSGPDAEVSSREELSSRDPAIERFFEH